MQDLVLLEAREDTGLFSYKTILVLVKAKLTFYLVGKLDFLQDHLCGIWRAFWHQNYTLEEASLTLLRFLIFHLFMYF